MGDQVSGAGAAKPRGAQDAAKPATAKPESANGAPAASASPEPKATRLAPSTNPTQVAPAKPAQAAAPNGAPKAALAAQAHASQKTASQSIPTPAANQSVLEDFDEIRSAGGLRLRQILPAVTISLVSHMLLLIILGLVAGETKKKDVVKELVAHVDEDQGEPLDIVEDTPVPLEVEVTEFTPVDAAAIVDVAPTIEAAPDVQMADIALDSMAPSDVMTRIGSGTSSSIVDSRSEKGRMQTVVARGGNSASEAAVAKALEWLAMHQLPDGGWSLDHNLAPSCQGKCQNPGGHVQARMGATALGLLPFLGAGQTHKQGKYKKEVQAALFFIANRMKVTPNGGDCTEPRGTLYSHGLCAIALCEAYAMSQDKGLAAPAQAALNFISYAQDPTGGGWRYSVRQPGDTSVVGWQLMALKSGHMGKLFVNGSTVKGATRFLDSVQTEGGTYYGYTEPSPKPRGATTAVGLLCRMYLGWKHDEPALERGVQYLAKVGPSKSDVYYNYYATQVLHQYEGDLWTKWNDTMRDQLVETQAKNGHEVGSWFSGAGGHANDAGGRLYCTSLSCMTLEVYYRHLPLYKKSTAEDDF